MKKKALILLILFVFLGIIFISNAIIKSRVLTRSRAEEQSQTTLKIMSYNIFHGDPLTLAEHRQKARTIAAYIKQNQIEIAGLQEVRPLDPDPDVADMLVEELQAIGYPMYLSRAPVIKDNYFINITLSKYVILETQTFGQNPCSNGVCTRNAVMSRIQTPIGIIRFIDTHVHHGEDNCDSIDQYNRIVQPFQSDPNTVMVGDYNSTLTSCSQALANAYSATCEQSNECSTGDVIDWIFLPKNNSNLVQVSRVVDESINASDHFPVVGVIRTLMPQTVAPSPTSTVILTPTPGGDNPMGTPTSTPALDLTVVPPTVTNTPVPTEPPLPTLTSTPVPTSTLVPTATYTPVPTSTPRPTYTIQPTYTVQPPYSGPTSYIVKYVTSTSSMSSSLNSSPGSSTISDVTVNGQKPGIAPWMYILGPVVLVLVGVFL